MALNFSLQLADSEGLMKVIVFTGLSHPVAVHPIVHGEPVLTAQAFYYLQELESVAHLRFENNRNELLEEEIEYLIDNYLFEFSKLHPSTKMTYKLARIKGKFWWNDPSDFYIGVDQDNAQSLAIDVMNDPHVHSVEALDPRCSIDLSDWNIGANYARECFQPYMDTLTSILDKKVTTFISPSKGRDGYIGKLSVLKGGHGLINYSQALALSDISIHSISPSATEVSLEGSNSQWTQDSLPIERIVVTKQYAPILLSHYFSGLKEHNPLKGFVGFYNVLEYYFEEAPQILRCSASTELAQLQCVVNLLTTGDEVTKFINLLEPAALKAVTADLVTSSGIAIKGFDMVGESRAELARWLYEIRCAVIHSKKTRRGRTTPTYEPYSSTSQVLLHVIPVVQWLAVLCIEKDHALTAAES